LKVQKRNSTLVDFDKNSIIQAIEKAMLETKEGIDTKLSHDIANKIESIGLDIFSVENIQDFVEDMLMESNRKDVAKRYIIYRNQRDKVRKNKAKGLLNEEFISKYKHLPSPMNQLGSFVYYRTYSRYLPEEQRREYWWETVKRAVEYNCSLVPTSKEEAEKLYDNVYNLRQFLSGRTFWVGGTQVAYKYPCSNFNCAFLIINSIKSFEELFYLLMVGTGVGVRVLKADVDKLPKIKNNIDIIHKEYNPLPKDGREDYTSLKFKKDIATIVVGDSKEGWSKALFYYLELLTNSYYENIKLIVFDYDNVRPKGERLKTFGGTASGHESIKNMFKKIHTIVKDSNKKLSTLNCLDIANIIGENVVVGGVRRTAENGLIDHDDDELINAKNNLYIQSEGQWIENKEISHRKMSNNSIFYTEKPTREKLHWQIEKMRYSGEPAFANAEAASKRRVNFEGLNPCFEVLLQSKGLCNLITSNVMSFVFNGRLNIEMLLEAQKLAVRAGYRMTCVDLELHEWDLVQKEDRLLGCSLTGWQDMVNATNMSLQEQKETLLKLKDVAIEESKKYSSQLNMKEPLLVTTVKPEGCWTIDHLRTLDNGILRLDEINEDIENINGFKDVEGYSRDNHKVTKTYSNDVKDILKVKLKNGRELKITPAHPMSINNQWVKAEDIKISNIIDYKLGSYTNDNHYKLKDVTVLEFRSDIRDYKTPKYINEDVSWLIGAYMANGSFTTQDRIKFHCQHFNVHKKVQKIWLEQFGVETSIIESSDRDSYTQDFRSTKIRKWLDFNGLDKEYNYTLGIIPKVIRQSSVNDIINFIIGYADNDGCFHSNSFCIDSINEPLMRHIQEVGEAVGISFGISINSKRNSFGTNPVYKLHLSRSFSNEDAINYINKISVKAQINPVVKSHIIRSANPYKVINIETIEQQKTYDIEVDTEHWYYQGGLKSHNTLSLLPGVSSGVHYSHSPFYIRRIRINSDDPLVKVCEELSYPVFDDGINTKVIEFPVKSPKGKTKYDVSAIEQLEIYKMFQECYVQHNTSITIHVRENEWDEVEQWLWDNWDDVIGVSFLSLSDSFYHLMPYEAITEEEYNKRVKEMNPFIPSLLSKYEKEEVELDIGNDGCSSGVCPIR